MSLNIASFDNNLPLRAQNALAKALGHPLAAEGAVKLEDKLKKTGKIAVYDPLNIAEMCNLFYPVPKARISGVYVQKIEDSKRELWGHKVQLISELAKTESKILFIAAFDAAKIIPQLKFSLPEGMEIFGLDDLRIPSNMLSAPNDYLSSINFATNFALMQEGGGKHTRVSIINYWTKYGAKAPKLWLRLFDAKGKTLATWEENLTNPGGMYHFDSAEIRKKFGLGEFTGSLFIHATNIAGHDIVKYVQDHYGDSDDVLSVTHDANSWPADFYAGLPVLSPGDEIKIWVQNSHPVTIPKGAIHLREMGANDSYPYKYEIPPFGTSALDIKEIMPARNHPCQAELIAGKYFVRPRYEVKAANGRSFIAHLNVERTDLAPDPNIAKNAKWLGKGYILALPILPPEEFETVIVPTPMATSQNQLPLQLLIYDASGEKIFTKKLGTINRTETEVLAISNILKEAGKSLKSGYGHAELIYDFADSQEADGWLHAVGHYKQKSGHQAETSFGSHIYNMLETFKDEPQSYSGKPPGLTTRLYLRLGRAKSQFCHLIYQVSKDWHPHSDTALVLHDGQGNICETVKIKIPANGSLLWYYHEIFSPAAINKAGSKAYVIVQDSTCRLFGYHGLKNGQMAFALDHMFGC